MTLTDRLAPEWKKCQAWECTSESQYSGKQKQDDLCELESSLVYTCPRVSKGYTDLSNQMKENIFQSGRNLNLQRES